MFSTTLSHRRSYYRLLIQSPPDRPPTTERGDVIFSGCSKYGAECFLCDHWKPIDVGFASELTAKLTCLALFLITLTDHAPQAAGKHLTVA